MQYSRLNFTGECSRQKKDSDVDAPQGDSVSVTETGPEGVGNRSLGNTIAFQATTQHDQDLHSK